MWAFIGNFIAVCFCLGVMACAALAVWACNYVTTATAEDKLLLNLDNLEQSQSSIVYKQHYDHEDNPVGDWYESCVFKSPDSHRLKVELSKIPENLQNAFICTEDKDFWTHHGVSFKRTFAAAINEYTPIKLFGSRQGASTLEQQLIKNLLDDDDQSGLEGVKRKLREIYRAWNLDNVYSKETILENYLNTISFTGTIQGVQTAAKEYFGKDVSDLSLPECAVIASITKNPTKYNPYTNPEELINRRNLVLANMYKQGKISEEDYQAAKEAPLVLVEENSQNTTAVATNQSYYEDAIFNALTSQIMEKENVSKKAAQNLIYTGGFQIYSCENPDLQGSMEDIMMNSGDKYFPAGWREEEVSELRSYDVPVYEKDGVTLKTKTKDDGTVVYYRKVRTQAAMVSMDYDGNVRGIVGGIGEKTADLALNRATEAPRQCGSTMKPIGPYSLAIEYGLYNWSSMLNDSPLYAKEDMKIRDEDYCRKHGLSGLSDDALRAHPAAWRDWPRNYNFQYSYQDIPLYDGLQRSLNTIAARVGETVGTDKIYNFAHDTLNMSTLVPEDNSLASMILGSQSYGVTTLDLCAAFQIFYDGTYNTPRFYTEVYDAEGNLYLEADMSQYQALTPETARIMNRLLRNVLISGTAAGQTPQGGNMEAVGKTGTASDWKDFSFVGLTPYYVTATWWGYDVPTKMKSLGSTKNCVNAWKALMNDVQKDMTTKKFPDSKGVVTAAFCQDTGLLANPGCPNRGTGYYKADDMPAHCDMH